MRLRLVHDEGRFVISNFDEFFQRGKINLPNMEIGNVISILKMIITLLLHVHMLYIFVFEWCLGRRVKEGNKHGDSCYSFPKQ